MDTQNSIIDKLLAENSISELNQAANDTDQSFYLSHKQDQPYVVASFIDTHFKYDESFFNVFMQGISIELPKDSVIQLSFVHEGYEDYKKLSVQKNEDLNECEKAELLEIIDQCIHSIDEQEQNSIQAGKFKPALIRVKIPTHADLKPDQSKKLVQVVYEKLKGFLMAEIRHLNREEYVVHHLIY